jgi:hypothetical protein
MSLPLSVGPYSKIYQIYNIYNIQVYRIKTNSNIQLNITNLHSCFKLALYAKCKYSQVQSTYVSITHSSSCSVKYICIYTSIHWLTTPYTYHVGYQQVAHVLLYKIIHTKSFTLNSYNYIFIYLKLPLGKY